HPPRHILFPYTTLFRSQLWSHPFMPFAVYILGLAVFAQGTSEFMLSGLIADIARELNVSISAAGALTSAFAAGMIVGAPLMALRSEEHTSELQSREKLV